MTIALVLLAISAVVFLASAVVYKLVNRWIDLPDFYWNRSAKTLVYCGAVDYQNAVANGSFVRSPCGHKLVLVPDIRIYDCPDQFRDWRAGLLETSVGPFYRIQKLVPNLFVPFLNETLMTFEDQKRFFKKPLGHESDFADQKRQLNRAADWRRLFANLAIRDKIRTVRRWSALAVALSFITCGWMGTVRMNAKSDAQPITVHITLPNGAMREVHSTVGEHRKLLMYDGYGSSLILKSRVSELQSGGGGLMRVRVKQSNGRIDCAFADSSLGLRVGDTVYMRFATWLRWASREDRVDARFEGEYSVITEAEAKALVGTGKFKIVE